MARYFEQQDGDAVFVPRLRGRARYQRGYCISVESFTTARCRARSVGRPERGQQSQGPCSCGAARTAQKEEQDERREHVERDIQISYVGVDAGKDQRKRFRRRLRSRR